MLNLRFDGSSYTSNYVVTVTEVKQGIFLCVPRRTVSLHSFEIWCLFFFLSEMLSCPLTECLRTSGSCYIPFRTLCFFRVWYLSYLLLLLVFLLLTVMFPIFFHSCCGPRICQWPAQGCCCWGQVCSLWVWGQRSAQTWHPMVSIYIDCFFSLCSVSIPPSLFFLFVFLSA